MVFAWYLGPMRDSLLFSWIYQWRYRVDCNRCDIRIIILDWRVP